MNVIGARVKFICSLGTRDENGQSISICLKNGTWSVNPQCTIGKFNMHKGTSIRIRHFLIHSLENVRLDIEKLNLDTDSIPDET